MKALDLTQGASGYKAGNRPLSPENWTQALRRGAVANFRKFPGAVTIAVRGAALWQQIASKLALPDSRNFRADVVVYIHQPRAVIDTRWIAARWIDKARSKPDNSHAPAWERSR